MVLNQNNRALQTQNQNPRNLNNQPLGKNRVFALQAGQDGVEGTLRIFSHVAKVLFDTGYAYLFISQRFVLRLGLDVA